MGDSQIVIYAAYFLVGAATYIVARMLLQEEETRAAQESLGDTRSRQPSHGLVKITRPFFNQYLLPIVRGKKNWDGKRNLYRRRLITAGLKDELTADEFIAFKIFLIGFFPIVAGFLNALSVLDLEWYYVLGSGVLGWFYPDFWVRARIQSRQREMLKALPFIVDLLALSTEAGLDFVGAIGKVVEKSAPNPLVEEFEQVLKEIKIGSSRAEALREMAVRVDMTEVNSFIAILISADQMGASIGGILRQQSEQIRSERFVRAEKEGAKAPTRLILVTGALILPAVLLLIGAPFILGFIGASN